MGEEGKKKRWKKVNAGQNRIESWLEGSNNGRPMVAQFGLGLLAVRIWAKQFPIPHLIAWGCERKNKEEKRKKMLLLSAIHENPYYQSTITVSVCVNT